MATDRPKPMSPSAAVARHLEWLEFALAAARDEEVRRQGRLDKATDKNREKRDVRLAEVKAEVVELAALVTGLKGLQAGAATRTRKPAAARRSTPAAARRRAPSPALASSTAAPATSAPKPKAPTKKPAVTKAATAKSRGAANGAPKPPTS